MADAEHGQGVAPAGAEPPKHRKKYMVVGTIVAILLVCLGAVLMKQAIRRQAPPAVPQAAGETGIVRLQELVQAHPAYGDLQKLLQERKELKARLQESTELAAPLAVQPPEVEQKPFDDSVWQKNAQDVIGRPSGRRMHRMSSGGVPRLSAHRKRRQLITRHRRRKTTRPAAMPSMPNTSTPSSTSRSSLTTARP